MAAAPRYKLFDPKGTYQASSKDPALLAACIGLLGEGSTIKDGRDLKRVLWTEGEGRDGIAWESYDAVCDKCYERQSPHYKD